MKGIRGRSELGPANASIGDLISHLKSKKRREDAKWRHWSSEKRIEKACPSL